MILVKMSLVGGEDRGSNGSWTCDLLKTSRAEDEVMGRAASRMGYFFLRTSHVRGKFRDRTGSRMGDFFEDVTGGMQG